MEEGRGLDPQWRTTRSLSKRCRSPDRLTFRIGGWRSTRSPCLAAPSVFKAAPASLAGSPSILAYRIGFEPMSSTFGGSRSSAELPVVIAGARQRSFAENVSPQYWQRKRSRRNTLNRVNATRFGIGMSARRQTAAASLLMGSIPSCRTRRQPRRDH